MSRRAVVAALAALALVPVPAAADSTAYATHLVVDAAFVVAGDRAANPRVTVAATVTRYTASGTSLRPTGPVSGSWDGLVVCLAYATAGRREMGCAQATPGRAVTDGTLLPEGATVKVRVPVRGRRGGWIEADLRLVANTPPLASPVHATRWTHDYELLGQRVPVGTTAIGGTTLWRGCAVTGTVRTDRGLKVPVTALPGPLVATSVLRLDSRTVTVIADPDDLTARVAAATLDALPA